MGVMVQIRDVPDELHKKLKSRADADGLSLSEYLSKVLKSSAAVPTKSELWDRIKKRPRVKTSVSASEALRLEREARDARLDEARGANARR